MLLNSFFSHNRNSHKVYEEFGKKFNEDNILRSFNPSKLSKIFDSLVLIAYLHETKQPLGFKPSILNAIPWDMEKKQWVNKKDFEHQQSLVKKKEEENQKENSNGGKNSKPKTKKQVLDEKEENVMDILYAEEAKAQVEASETK